MQVKRRRNGPIKLQVARSLVTTPIIGKTLFELCNNHFSRICGENVVLIKINSDLDYMTRNDFENTGEECVQRWYGQVADYDFVAHGKTGDNPIGSFTQTVWKDSQILGVGISLRTDGEYIVGRDFLNFLKMTIYF